MTTSIQEALALLERKDWDGLNPETHAIVQCVDPEEASRWRIINDDVMGGVSRSSFQIIPGTSAVFSGVLSLENNGGFCSARRLPGAYDLGSWDGIQLRAIGDGRRYHFRVRTDDAYDGVAYKVEFDTVPGKERTLRLPWDRFEPTFRGRPVPDAPKLQPQQIRQLGLLIADRRSGGFRIEVLAIAAYRERPLRQVK